MIVYIDRDSGLYYGVVKIDKESHGWQRGRSVEIPDELVTRHEKAQQEYSIVQELLEKIYDRV